MARPDTDDYRALFLTPTPMIDLRAPAEFARGAFPTALSLPLMTDDERAQVGIRYKEAGQQSAIDLGHELVQGDVRARRVAAWREFAECYPGGYVYCWRGGLRSSTVQQWLREEGVHYPRVLGGYKAMRRFLLEELEKSLTAADIVLISGKTGTGKTRVIERLARSVDLEGLANHRGSSFGQMPSPQPSQIDFENSLSIQLMRFLHASDTTICMEDEGRLVGRIALPNTLQARMRKAPMLVVEQTLEERIDVVLEDYIEDLGRRYALAHGEEGARKHAEKMQSDLSRIKRRLGGERYARVSNMMREAFAQQWRSDNAEQHRGWIGFLLGEYYDPMYEYQLAQRRGDRIFVGDRDSVLARAMELTSGAGSN